MITGNMFPGRLGFVLFVDCAVAAISVSPLASQTSTGSIRGYVTDSSGAPIAGARVVAVNAQTSSQREVSTQSNGFYAMLGLVPAEYEVTARQVGMAPQRIRLRVLIGEVYPLDFRLAASAIEGAAVTGLPPAARETRTSDGAA